MRAHGSRWLLAALVACIGCTALERSIEFYHVRANPRLARPSMEGQGFEATQEWRTERRLGR